MGCAQRYVTKSGAVADCRSWRIQSKTRELPLAIVMLTLCRNSDRLLLACVPARTTSSLLLLTQLLEVRLRQSTSRPRVGDRGVISGLFVFNPFFHRVCPPEGRIGVSSVAARVAATACSADVWTPMLSRCLRRRVVLAIAACARAPAFSHAAGRPIPVNADHGQVEEPHQPQPEP